MNARVYHRYLGFFLAGIMAVYAISGMLLIFRNTDFLKQQTNVEKVVDKGLAGKALGEAIKKKGISFEGQSGPVYTFDGGTYDAGSGKVAYVDKKLPYLLDKMTSLHKATHKSRFYYMNLFFGASLLFFVLSSFWMFIPSSDIFKKGMYFTIAGIVLTLALLFIG